MQSIRGFKDLLDEQGGLYERVLTTCSNAAKSYGYSFINLPHLEYSSLFRRSVGESSDIVGKEMYEFLDKSNDLVCLRPEGTAGAVRAYIEHKFDKAKAKKRWFYHGSMFRYERPQKGRLREFHQFGVECFGEESFYEDAKIICMLSLILKELDISASLRINNLGDAQSMAKYKALLKDFAFSKALCEDCNRRLGLNPLRVLDCKNEACQEQLQKAPKMSSSIEANCAREHEELLDLLSKAGISFVKDESLVRGLDYYCKCAFEFESSAIGAKAAIAGGGRYDRLVEYLGGKPSFGVGFAIGLERLMLAALAAADCGQVPLKREGAMLCALDHKYLADLFLLHEELRGEKLLMQNEARKLNKAMQEADKQGFSYLVALGEEEHKNGFYFVKDLENGSNLKLKKDELKLLLQAR